VFTHRYVTHVVAWLESLQHDVLPDGVRVLHLPLPVPRELRPRLVTYGLVTPPAYLLQRRKTNR
jgi:hypothetical protein